MRRNQCPKFDVKTSLQTHYVISTLIRRRTMSHDVFSKLKRRLSTGINPEYQTNVILFYNYVVKFSKCCHTIMINPHLTFLAKLTQRWYNLFNIEKRNLMLRFQRCINVSWGGNVAMTLNIWRRSIDVVKTSWNWPRDFNVPATLWAQHPYYVMSSTYLPTLRQRRNNVVLLTL